MWCVTTSNGVVGELESGGWSGGGGSEVARQGWCKCSKRSLPLLGSMIVSTQVSEQVGVAACDLLRKVKAGEAGKIK